MELPSHDLLANTKEPARYSSEYSGDSADGSSFLPLLAATAKRSMKRMKDVGRDDAFSMLSKGEGQ